MKYIFLYIITILSILLTTCKKDDVKIADITINTENVVKGITFVQITVDYTYPTTLQSVVGYISPNSDMSNAINADAKINGQQFVVRFDNLSANTYYHYYFEYNNGIDVINTIIKNVTTNDYGLPKVTTIDVFDITSTFATSGGDVTDDGGLEITARGICWSTSQNPTISDNHTTDGTGNGSFISYLTGLTPYTTYYVRAYSTNSKGTSYGKQKTFKTKAVGVFSVSSSHEVIFSQGNLQYKASTNTWHFAENQWDQIGDYNSNISSSYSGWIDLFGWGTSGYNHGAVCYQPWSTSMNNSDYYAYGNDSYNLNDQTGQADWGFNPISNGENQLNQWRTLTDDEWVFVFNTRSTPSGIRYAKANVNGVNGVILLPDNWSSSYYNLNSTNTYGASFIDNTISASQWNTLEQHGAVFLPATGYRNGTSCYDVDSCGDYWSATEHGYDNAYCVYFTSLELILSATGCRYSGRAVRLVCDVE